MTLEDYYKANRERLVKKIARRGGSPDIAEDIVQEAFYRALKYADSFDPTQPFEGWFTRILNNSLKAYKNAEKRGSYEQFDEEDVDGTDCRMFNQQLWEQIRQEINQYNDEHYEVLNLYFEHGYKPRDICKVVDMKYKNVETVLQRFKRNIKDTYGEEL